jgi:Predicted O-methyltransferase
MAKSYFERFGLLDKAEFRVGNAIEIAKEFKDIDILFLDLEKIKYLEAILTLKDNLKVGSLVIADNTLWYGKVAQDNPDDKTAKIKEFNEYMFKSKEFLVF